MNLLIHFCRDNHVNLCLIFGIFMMMAVFVCAIYMGTKQAGVKKTNKLFGERGIRKSITKELYRKVVQK